jgi:hypothetical protein
MFDVEAIKSDNRLVEQNIGSKYEYYKIICTIAISQRLEK